MSADSFVAQRILIPPRGSLSGFIARLCIFATAISVCGMILASALFNGFEQAVAEKFYDSWGHIQVSNTPPGVQLFSEDELFSANDSIPKQITQLKGVKQVTPFLIKPAFAYKKGKIEGIVLKGIDFNFHSSLLNAAQVFDFAQGNANRQIALSTQTMRALGVEKNDSVVLYFFSKGESIPRARKLQVAASFESGMEENDKRFAFCTIAFLQSLSPDSVGKIHGYEVYCENYKQIDNIVNVIHQNVIEAPLQVFSVNEKFKNIFVWLDLIKHDVWIVYIILVIIALVNMGSTMLILILERTNTIGLLKAMGMTNHRLRLLFYKQTLFITLIGLLLGFLLAVLLAGLQQYFHIIQLDPKVYYIDEAKIKIVFKDVAGIFVVVLILINVLMFLPARLINKLSPLKAIRFD